MIVVTSTTVVEPPPSVGDLGFPGVSPPVERVTRLGVMLTGVDGSTWDLYNGPVVLMPGARFFSTPDPEHWFTDAPALDGSRWTGARVPRGEPYLPVFIDADDPLQWRDNYAAFMRAVRSPGLCYLTVVTPDSQSRTLAMRYVSGANAEYETDPLLIRYGAYGLTFATEDPYWQGWPIRTQFADIALQPRFPGPPWRINPTNTIGSTSVTNPGDVDAFGVWTVTAPFQGFTVGVGGETTTVVATKTTGFVQIDNDPRRQTIRDETGADMSLAVVDAGDNPMIPAGAKVPLSLNLIGAGAGTSIELLFTPRFREAM